MDTTHVDSSARAASCKHGLRSSIALVLASVASVTVMTLLSTDVQAGECYKDDIGRIVARRRVGYVEVPCPDSNTPVHMAGAEVMEVRSAESTVLRRQVRQREAPTSISPLPVPNLMALAEDEAPINRWEVVENLGYESRWWDPYNRNPLKGDKPVKDDWFFSMSIASDTAVELRSVPGFANGVAGTHGSHQSRLSQNVVSEFTVYQGDTVFMPPKWLFRFAPSFSYNQIGLRQPEPLDATLSGSHMFAGVQTAFAEKLLRVASARYDFDSLRVGIQPFSTDFRGFLYQGSQAGVRFYGTRGGNQWQYNVAWLRRLADDDVSGLTNPAAGLRHDEVLVANLYRQDFPIAGFTSQVSFLHNRNREGSKAGSAQTRSTDLNTPFSHGLRDYDVSYLGYNGDGHFGRLNLTTSAYYAFGKQTSHTIEGASADISAFFVAAELSADFSWIRPRISLLYASGDNNPTDGKLNGFDSVGENPQFAGADASYALRQSIPVLGFGTAAPSTRNGVLNSLRSSSNDRQSNFNNPGTMLLGFGVDMDLTPQLRTSLNLNSVHFADTRILEITRKQSGLDSHIGYDASLSLIWRPLATQNIVLRAAYGALLPGGSYKSLFPGVKLDHMLLQATLNY
jgi:hypothetical protein